MNDEITEALERQENQWSWIAMTGNHYGFGDTEAEARKNCSRPGPESKRMRVGEFTGPVKVVVDSFGRIYWDDGDVKLEWVVI